MKTAFAVAIILSLILTPVIFKGEEAKTCSKCGTALKADWNICPMCGKDLRREEATTCPQCGHPLEREWKFCPLCRWSRSEDKKAAGKATEEPGERILWDFENPGQLSESLLKEKIKVGLSSEHATSGKRSVRLDWPKGGGPSFRYEGQLEDFSSWRYLKLDAFNPGKKPVTILIKFKSSDHQKKTTLGFEVPPEEEKIISIRLDALARKIDLSDVMYFNIFVWKPVEPGTIFIDNIRLSNE